ncbi:MAG: indole-3-glycerol phosphate synthase TrpC [Silvibacterium sp.]|nr:indole-3-glycerol phosphate synthase TrpC [Silvibacterium sp.]
MRLIPVRSNCDYISANLRRATHRSDGVPVQNGDLHRVPIKAVDILKFRSELVHLKRILETTRATVARRKSEVRVEELQERALSHAPRGFARALRSRPGVPAIIAELKKASPSKGLIRESFDAAALARRFEAGGAAALSVLTDEPYFQGSLRNLEIASSVTALPCLRKDFIVDEYQIVEARAHCADAILLIVAALSDVELERFTGEAHRHGLDVLCEVHSEGELERVRGLGCDAYGVNNRNLETFEVSLETSLRLASRLPSDAVRVAESGIHSAEDIERLRAAGFDAFLVGESLMRQPDPGAALQALLAPAAERV